MAHISADRVKDTTTTTGAGTVTLANSAPTGFRTFGSVLANGDTCFYCIEAGAEWEVGLGTYATSGTTLARTTVLASSNAGAAVNFSAGTKNVFLTAPASQFSNKVPVAAISNNYAILQQDGALAVSSTGAADTIYCAPFIIFRRTIITQLGFNVTTAVGASNGQVAIYPNANGRPGTAPIIATGNLSMASTAAVLETLGAAVTLEPGIYWACINRSNTAAYAAIATAQLCPIATVIGSSTMTDVIAAGGVSVAVALSASRTFGTWGDISGLTYTYLSTVPRQPALLVKFQ